MTGEWKTEESYAQNNKYKFQSSLCAHSRKGRKPKCKFTSRNFVCLSICTHWLSKEMAQAFVSRPFLQKGLRVLHGFPMQISLPFLWLPVSCFSQFHGPSFHLRKETSHNAPDLHIPPSEKWRRKELWRGEMPEPRGIKVRCKPGHFWLRPGRRNTEARRSPSLSPPHAASFHAPSQQDLSPGHSCQVWGGAAKVLCGAWKRHNYGQMRVRAALNMKPDPALRRPLSSASSASMSSRARALRQRGSPSGPPAAPRLVWTSYYGLNLTLRLKNKAK